MDRVGRLTCLLVRILPRVEDAVLLKHELAFPGAEYAQVLRMLGNGRLEAMCIDSTKRLCHIRGKMRKKVWVNTVSTLLSTYEADLALPAPGIFLNATCFAGRHHSGGSSRLPGRESRCHS